MNRLGSITVPQGVRRRVRARLGRAQQGAARRAFARSPENRGALRRPDDVTPGSGPRARPLQAGGVEDHDQE